MRTASWIALIALLGSGCAMATDEGQTAAWDDEAEAVPMQPQWDDPCEYTHCSGEGELCGGLVGFQCGPGLVCNYSNLTSCDMSDAPGVCVSEQRTTFCFRYGFEVCGCDERTYRNDCLRRAAGVPFDHIGRCYP